MIRAIADTHALIWYQYADARLSVNAKAVFDTAVKQGDSIGVSAITIMEMVYLVEKKRIPADAVRRTLVALTALHSVLSLVPLDGAVASTLTHLNRAEIPDMLDRIIAATALYLGVPVISRDHKIVTSSIQTIW